MKMTNQLCVPIAALSMSGEEGAEPVAPGQNDEVDFTGHGRVARVDGTNAYIDVTEVNETPIGGDMKPANLEEMSGDEGEEELRSRYGNGGEIS
jgi:hypothetical protein